MAQAPQEQDLPPDKAAAFQFAVNAQRTVQQMGPQQVVQQVASSGDPSQGVGQMAAMLMDAQVQSAMDSGKQITTQMISAGMGRIVQDLSMLAQAGGALQVQSPEEGKAFAQQAFATALKLYGDNALQREGMEQQGMQQEMDQMPPEAGMPPGMPPQQAAPMDQGGMPPQEGMLAGMMGGM